VLEGIGRTLIVVGAMILLVGVLLYFVGKVPGLGRLPGDIIIERERFRLYIPLGTMLLVSILLTLLLTLLGRLRP
jgi:hypothetical protein